MMAFSHHFVSRNALDWRNQQGVQLELHLWPRLLAGKELPEALVLLRPSLDQRGRRLELLKEQRLAHLAGSDPMVAITWAYVE